MLRHASLINGEISMAFDKIASKKCAIKHMKERKKIYLENGDSMKASDLQRRIDRMVKNLG